MPSFSIVRQLLNASAVLALSYAAGVMTIATGFFIASQVPGTSISHRNTSGDVSSATTASPSLSDHDNVVDTETELDYMLEDVSESIGRYETSNCTTTQTKFGTGPMDRMYLNELLQSKCTYGPDIGTSTGTLLTNYLNGGDVERNELKQNWSDVVALDDMIPKTQPRLFFPTLWFKFI